MNEASAVTILLAEDDLGHASLIERNLKRSGFVNQVIHVVDGQEALDYLQIPLMQTGETTQPVVTAANADAVGLLAEVVADDLQGLSRG